MSHLHHRVSALIDGELTGRARARALAHARGCVACRRELVETLAIKQRLNRLSPVEVSPDLLAVVQSRGRGLDSARSPRTDDSRDEQHGHPVLRRAFAGVGSVSAFVLALAYVVGAPATTQAASVSPPVDDFAHDFADSTGASALSDPAVQAMAQGASLLGLGIVRSKSRSYRQLGSAAHTTGARCASVGKDQTPAVTALHRAVEAPQHVSYRAARVVNSVDGTAVDSYRLEVEHVSGYGTTFTVPKPGGADVTTFVPATGSMTELEGMPVDALLESYDLSVERTQIIDSRRVTIIDACQHDQLMARFWVDDASGLLLRKAMYVGNDVVRWSGLANFQPIVSEASKVEAMQQAPAPMRTNASQVLSSAQASALSDEGWICPARLASDFDLSLLDQVDTDGNTMHVGYTDGLSTLSVFEQHGTLDPATLAGFEERLVGGQLVYLRTGLPTLAVWQSGDTVITIVTDVPQQRVGALLQALPHLPMTSGSGVTGRIGTGLDKLASAVAP